MIFVPFAVAAPFASTHSPDCTPAMLPLLLTFHCWLTWPLQSQMITAVPLVVPWPFASRHLLPYTWNCLPVVYDHCWLVWPLQSHRLSCVPLLWDWLGTSRHRPELVFTSADPGGGGLLPDPATTERLSNCAVTPWPVPKPT